MVNEVSIELARSLTTIERQTYNILEFLGDVGGLFDGLKIIGGLFVSPIAAFVLKVTLMAGDFKLVGAKGPAITKRIWFPCTITREQRHYSKLMKKAEHRLTK